MKSMQTARCSSAPNMLQCTSVWPKHSAKRQSLRHPVAGFTGRWVEGLQDEQACRSLHVLDPVQAPQGAPISASTQVILRQTETWGPLSPAPRRGLSSQNSLILPECWGQRGHHCPAARAVPFCPATPSVVS